MVTNNNPTDKSSIDALTKNFFSVFSNADGREPALNIIYQTCIPQTVIVKKNQLMESVYNLDTFIEPRKKILTDGTLTDFEEMETEETTHILGNIAQRSSRYKKSGYLNGRHFEEYGNKLFQFIKTIDGWKISALVWEDDLAKL